ncbi:T9SS type A sorting domain-containing protein [Winogradskyella sp. UBA3174]|nr:T9SS type A sorting domain-containing protein [Winogradskyella sp. UBA3174]
MRITLNSGDIIFQPLNELESYRYDQNSLSQSDLESLNNDLKIYPNPTKHSVTFSFNPKSNTPYDYRLVDMLGKVILSKDLGVLSGPFSNTLDIQSLPSGVFFLELRNATEKISKKIIKF